MSDTKKAEEIEQRLRAACNGHPHAKIPWPHRLLHEAADEMGRLLAVAAAVEAWAANCEGQPDNPNDADLLKALWTFGGDRLEPCPECDGACGEPCSPCTVVQAHAGLDAFSAQWREKHGLRSAP